MPLEREITRPVALTLTKGKLNRDAVGWTRTPRHTTDGLIKTGLRARHWGRTKRWEYWALTTPTHALGLTVSAIDYAGVNALFLLDRRTGEQIATDVITPLGRGVRLPGTLGDGPATFSNPKLAIALDPTPDGGTHLTATTDRVTLDATVPLPDGHERLGVVVPWSDRLFQYTVKDVGRPARGTLTVDGTAYPLVPGTAWATLDHGRGRWPYAVIWNWGAGAGLVDGRTIGLQLGGLWTDGTGATENALTVDGRLAKISDELTWAYAADDWLRPWRITGGEVDVTFHPEHVREAVTQLGIIASRTHQCFGTWSGWVGEQSVEGLYGWAEDVHQRW